MLRSNYPNPFNPATTIEFSLSQSEHVNLAVYDNVGELVTLLFDERATAGTHRIVFTAKALASGVYYCRLSTPEKTEAKRMVLIR